MNEAKAKEILDIIVKESLGIDNHFSLEQFAKKYAYDVKLPYSVNDFETGEETWAQSINPVRFMSFKNTHKKTAKTDFMQPVRKIDTIIDVLEAWNNINFTTTERFLESINIAKSDNIHSSEDIYHSQDCHFSKKLLFCDGVFRSEYVAASQRSNNCTYSVRIEDSENISKSFAVVWSAKITNSIFIEDSNNLQDCMLCSHINSKRFCIANMQFSEEEYIKYRQMIVNWLIS